MKTILYDQHLALNAKIVPFASFDMPLHYGSILKEYEAVRTHAGVFDVSHMGRIECTGSEALKFFDSLSTNSLFPPHKHTAKYSVLCDAEGGAIDDVIIYTVSEEKVFLVANSSNRLKVLEHLQHHSKEWTVSIVPQFEDEGILSLQGRRVSSLELPFLPPLERFQFQEVLFQHTPILVARTGYTGEDGYEFFAPNTVLKGLWELLVSQAHPCGLGSRDLLRLDMGYALYGHELSPSINPVESVAAFAVKMQDREFVGKRATERLLESGTARHAAGLKGTGKAIARDGYLVFDGADEVGGITSGNFSPALGAPIALALLTKKYEPGAQLFVKIREELHPFEIIKPPFINIKKQE
ncbi:MAG: glycine cleavage system aminomethyltransferase GcvT [Parachlamydiaceae bacterium]